eukprot:CAMPEP_0181366958 /NCGR_PEP_ID=MMETSP1106-20121128/11042_1 /TAXON_ID=81844 /ORGANISM="Mantoniella antarctica, Strain SL-175" /LENGTH=124 /DNA_ID=CAMNT_0023482463 /DNA_START=28 /DNA_END=398 /DNA_ORIENTATION=+
MASSRAIASLWLHGHRNLARIAVEGEGGAAGLSCARRLQRGLSHKNNQEVFGGPRRGVSFIAAAAAAAAAPSGRKPTVAVARLLEVTAACAPPTGSRRAAEAGVTGVVFAARGIRGTGERWGAA